MFIDKNILDFIKHSKIEYDEIFENELLIKNLSKKNRDINVYIPVKGRYFFVEPCIRYFKRAINNLMNPYRGKIKIVLIENDFYPACEDICKKYNIDYIFIPSFFNKNPSLIAKSLCYNVGYILSKYSTWSLFHDLDILITPDYFVKLHEYLKSFPEWIQPYQKKRVMKLNMLDTYNIVRNKNNYLDLKKLSMVSKARQGSTGGSLIVRSDIFEKVGGYDPELFWGYAPEDNFLWLKMETLMKCIDNVSNCHLNNKYYVKDDSLNVYHMDHANLEKSNSEFKRMQSIYQSFMTFDHHQKMNIINCKSNILKIHKKRNVIYEKNIFGNYFLTISNNR